jgi:uncharacterized membrane protein YidH (DUF202 family)
VNSKPRARPRPSVIDERTDLAWNRSGLALIACGIVIARGLTLSGFRIRDVAVGATILVLGVATFLLAGFHAHRRLRPGRAETRATARDLFPMALGVAIVGVAAFALGLFFPA